MNRNVSNSTESQIEEDIKEWLRRANEKFLKVQYNPVVVKSAITETHKLICGIYTFKKSRALPMLKIGHLKKFINSKTTELILINFFLKIN